MLGVASIASKRYSKGILQRIRRAPLSCGHGGGSEAENGALSFEGLGWQLPLIDRGKLVPGRTNFQPERGKSPRAKLWGLSVLVLQCRVLVMAHCLHMKVPEG